MSGIDVFKKSRMQGHISLIRKKLLKKEYKRQNTLNLIKVLKINQQKKREEELKEIKAKERELE